MSDTSVNKVIQYGTQAARIAFVPAPAVGSQILYEWYESDNAPDFYVWDGAAWVQVNGFRRVGNATLVGGTIAVVDASVTANTIILLSRKTIGGTAGNLTYILNAGVDFTINSDNALDTSVVSYFLVEP